MIFWLKHTLSRTLAFAGLTLLLSALVLAQDAAQGAARTDGQIETDAVHSLDQAQQLKDDLVAVATIQGEVTLSGTVASEENKKLAESIVSGINGVTKVTNNLKVGNPQQAAAGSADPEPMPEEDPQPAAEPAPSQPADMTQNQPAQPAVEPPTNTEPPAGTARITPPPSPTGYGRSPYSRPVQQRLQPATGPVTVPQGTQLVLRTNTGVDIKHAKAGETVDFTLMYDVGVGGALAIPRGATLHGVVAEAKKAGELAGSPELSLQLTSMDLGGQNYPLTTDAFLVKGPNKAGQTVGSALTGGLIGTIIGCAAGRGAGCAIGAGAGLAAGTAASAASFGPNIWIPAEARVDFRLPAPVTVNPVSSEEALRLAQGLRPGGPSLYRRQPGYSYPPSYYAGYGYGYPYGAAYGYPYGYSGVYFHPYVILGGGYHYWR